MKKLLSLLLAGAMVFALAAGCSNNTTNDGSGNNSQNTTGDKVVKIGVFEPLSGDSGLRRQEGIPGYAVRQL